MHPVCTLNGPIGVKESGVQDSSTILRPCEALPGNAKPHLSQCLYLPAACTQCAHDVIGSKSCELKSSFGAFERCKNDQILTNRR